MRSVENAEIFAAYFAGDPGALNVCNDDFTSSDLASASRSPMARDRGANNPAEVPRPTDRGRVGVPSSQRRPRPFRYPPTVLHYAGIPKRL